MIRIVFPLVPAPRGRLSAHVEVFKHNPVTGQQELVHTSIKKLPPCAACGRVLSGKIAGAGRHLVHADCGRRL